MHLLVKSLQIINGFRVKRKKARLFVGNFEILKEHSMCFFSQDIRKNTVIFVSARGIAVQIFCVAYHT